MNAPVIKKWMEDTVAALYDHVFTLPSSQDRRTTIQVLSELYDPTQKAVTELIDAIESRIKNGCNDTCASQLPEPGRSQYPCSCGHFELREALENYRNATGDTDA